MKANRHYLALDLLLFTIAAGFLLLLTNKLKENRGNSTSVIIIQTTHETAPRQSHGDQKRKTRKFVNKQAPIHPQQPNIPAEEYVSPYDFSTRTQHSKPMQLNKPDSSQLMALGVRPYVIRNWKKYLNRGGNLKDSFDVQRIYGMTTNQWNMIKDVLVYPERQPSERKPVLIQINEAGVESWSQLNGIGPVLSKRIVNFRDKLGGFARVAQVKETYGISDSLYHSFKHQLRLNSDPQILDINKLSKKELAAHPYISWKQAEVLVEYRKNHGPFQSIEDLRRTQVVTEEWLDKIKDYLSLDEALTSSE